jgi:hypothetical protein
MGMMTFRRARKIEESPKKDTPKGKKDGKSKTTKKK